VVYHWMELEQVSQLLKERFGRHAKTAWMVALQEWAVKDSTFDSWDYESHANPGLPIP
jgi:hypothetical protein